MLICVRVTWPAFYFLTEKPEMIPEKRKRVYTARNWSKVFTQVTVSHRCHPNCRCHLVCGIPVFVCKRRMWPMWVDENSEHADWETRIKKGKGKKKKNTTNPRETSIFFPLSERFDNLPPVRLKSVRRGVRSWKLAAEKKWPSI